MLLSSLKINLNFQSKLKNPEKVFQAGGILGEREKAGLLLHVLCTKSKIQGNLKKAQIKHSRADPKTGSFEQFCFLKCLKDRSEVTSFNDFDLKVVHMFLRRLFLTCARLNNKNRILS